MILSQDREAALISRPVFGILLCFDSGSMACLELVRGSSRRMRKTSRYF